MLHGSQPHRLMRAKAAVALMEELRRRPTDEELARCFRILDKAVAGMRLLSDDPGARGGGAAGC